MVWRMENSYLTVSQVNKYIRQQLERDGLLTGLYVVGELSSVSYVGGHIYVHVIDENASIRGVVFQQYADELPFTLSDGLAVIAYGYVSMYEKTGLVQLYIQHVEEIGEGKQATELAFLRDKLRSEGLFDIDKKKSLPFFAKRIGVLTSPTGAVIEDIRKVGNRRNPDVLIEVLPIRVQGKDAVEQIITQLKKAKTEAFDVLILARGGGSKEDLSPFQTEEVARAIFDADIPIISAVGHETDTTLADLVADKRAATPSEAAELAIREKSELVLLLSFALEEIKNSTLVLLDNTREDIEFFLDTKTLSLIRWRLDTEKSKLQSAYQQFKRAINEKITYKIKEVSTKNESLSQVSIHFILDRGFAYVQKENKWIQSVDAVQIGDELSIVLKDGEIKVQVMNTKEKKYDF